MIAFYWHRQKKQVENGGRKGKIEFGSGNEELFMIRLIAKSTSLKHNSVDSSAYVPKSKLSAGTGD